ncbi:hypothetical protein [Profundibacter sp.]|uniref:hypothetical protein n=1 Tax=Profundibacter sp. TaxID=3101071 RepID=UPI003D103510
MIRSNQAGQAKNRPPRREEGENGNLQRFPERKQHDARIRFTYPCGFTPVAIIQ